MKYFFNIANLVALITFLFCGQSFAQEWGRELFFRNISTEEGLSNPTINCIHEDVLGFIWIGTNDGLNRYDGHEFKVYQQNLADSNSIPNNKIHALYEDSEYNLWIATREGLSQFNYKDEKFNNYRSGDGFDLVMDISHDKINNRIWMASWTGGLKYLDLKSGIVRNFYHELLKDALPVKLLIFNEELFIGTSNNGVYKLNIGSYEVEEFCSTTAGRFQIPSNDINELHLSNNRLIIGTDGGGLIVYQFYDEKHQYYNPQNSSLPSSYISSIAHDNAGNIYIGTNKGIAIYSDQKELISANQEEEGNTSAISSNDINTLYIDKKDNLWVGTFEKGIDIQSHESKNMTLVKKKFMKKNSLSGNNISCFAQDEKGGIWIGTRNDGLNYYRGGSYTHYKADGAKGSLPDNTITDICINNKGMVWVSTLDHGFCVFENGKFAHFVYDKSNLNSIQSDKIRKMDIDKNGILWLATFKGLESYDIDNEVFRHHNVDKRIEELTERFNIRTVKVGSDGKILVGTSTGFFVYDPVSGKSDSYMRDPNDFNSLGHSMIHEIFEDSNKRIWLGSMGWGLIRFDRESKSFKSYNTLNGFPDNLVKSIQEDENGNLWLGTNKGIVKFNPSIEQVIIFGKSYGLQNDMFNRKASIKCKDGRLIFGGIDGFNVFRPEELEIGKNELDVIITDLRLLNQRVPVFGEPDILTQNISLVHSLRILYKQSKHFSVSFSALQFSNPEQVQYAYMLEGFDEDWNFIGNERFASFTNLEPENYVLKVMASDNGQWNKNRVRELKINIPPPWYMEIWFKVGVVILIIILIVSFYFYKIYTQRLRQRALEKLVVERNKEIACQNEEITSQNDALILSNDKLYAQHEEVLKQKEHIGSQNKELNEIQRELKDANSTLEKRVERRTKELKKSNVKLNKTVLELDRFVYSASHDLSAPLKSILGLVNIAKLENKDDNLEIYLDYIEDCIKKQDEVIKSLIQYSRNARQIIKVETINLFKFANQIIYELKYLPGSERIDIFNEVEKEVTINSDKQRLKMILINLLSNAIKYRDKSKKHSFVKIQFKANEDSCVLIVKDNGPGIAKDQKEKIFEMYYRATEESVGSGLGLFIVKEAVDRLGGKIELKSSIEEGATFVLTFPCK